MSPTEFICGLMRQDSDALGFIPKPAIDARWIQQGNFIIQTDRFGGPVGYLLHGPVNDARTMHINQACIEMTKRNRGFGQAAVAKLVKRAVKAGATNILLRCASDLDAVEFWISCGFVPIAIRPGGARRRRTIIQFEKSLHSPQKKSDSGPLPAGLRPNI